VAVLQYSHVHVGTASSNTRNVSAGGAEPSCSPSKSDRVTELREGAARLRNCKRVPGVGERALGSLFGSVEAQQNLRTSRCRC
jgi:hypothetical protein